jgi:hypothetical protein
MDFVKTTRKIPKLVNIPNETSTQKVPININWNLVFNLVVLFIFLIFTVFFLYNCKYGIFKVKTEQLEGYEYTKYKPFFN